MFALFFLLAAAYLGYKFVPPIFSNYQFQDAVNEEATFSLMRAGSRGQENAIKETRNNIFKKAKDLEIPVDKEDIKIKIGDERVNINVSYTVPIEILGYTYEMNFTVQSTK